MEEKVEEEYIKISHPLNPNQTAWGKIIGFKPVNEQPLEYVLENGTKVKIIIKLTMVIQAIDPDTKKPLYHPQTGEPFYSFNINSTVLLPI